MDDNLKPWVLEVNLSPSLSVESNLDFGVKTNMLADLFNMVGFKLFDRSRRQTLAPDPPFSDDFSPEELAEMIRETVAEHERSRGWKMLLPSLTDEFDAFFPEKRRRAYPHIREALKQSEKTK